MRKPVNIREAKTHLSRLVRRVQAGEEIVSVPDDFNAPLEPAIHPDFEG